MKKRLIGILLFLGVLMAHEMIAAQSPVKVTFSAAQVNDSVVQFKGSVALAKGFQLFTFRPTTPDDAFVSTLSIDSSLHTLGKIVEHGHLLSEKDNTVDAFLHYYLDSMTFTQSILLAKDANKRVKGTFSWLGKSALDFPSGDTTFSIAVNASQVINTAGEKENIIVKRDTIGDSSLWRIIYLCFFAGLVMVFTPCVFPLIPVTVSFFLKKSSSRAEGIRNALWYSLSIIFIYTVPTFLITLAFGQEMMYKIATSVTANLLFFVIFIVFAVSFFGAFELQLPNKWANKADEKAGKGGLLGIFFMALTLVIVSFSCTGPIVGTLLAQVSGTSAMLAPVLGMLGLSAGLALPFSLFAFFPSMLKALPKSGGWLNSVKVVFGFVELALAMKFLSSVDLMYGWHLLDREIFLVIWIVLSFLAGMYLLGKIKFSHDSDLKFVSIPRLFFAIAAFCFGMYLIPGLWGAPLKSMSGMLPPGNTQDFNLNELQYKIGQQGSGPNASGPAANPPKLYTDKLHDAPFGLTTYYDLDEGIAAAKALHKPIMLDFTGHSCTNCRKMENEVWSHPEVLNRLKNDFVIVSLYVDENSDLPAEQVYTDKSGVQVTTLAQKSRDYEMTKFGLLSQPLYMFIDTDQKPLSNVKYGYDSDVQKFVHHLDMYPPGQLHVVKYPAQLYSFVDRGILALSV